MTLLSPFRSGNTFDNTDRLARARYRLSTYWSMLISSLGRKVPISDLIRAQFPFALSDSNYPPIVSLEFTNYCNLQCPYCTNPLGQREKGFMSEAVFHRIIRDLSNIPVNRIQLVGNGESTLHPEFGKFLLALRNTRKHISLVTNGQWRNESVISQIMNAGPDLLEISVDAGGKEGYERSRIKGNYEKLLHNLKMLAEEKRRRKSKMVTILRLMLRPSTVHLIKNERKFFKQFVDRVMPQFVISIANTNYKDDVFIPVQRNTGSFPKCSLPFKHQEIKYTGDVLMCYYSHFQLGPPGLLLGNVKERSILELWNSPVMKQYRHAQRSRDYSAMPVCKGCTGT